MRRYIFLVIFISLLACVQASYIVGNLLTNNQLLIRMPFDGNPNVTFSSNATTLTPTNVRSAGLQLEYYTGTPSNSLYTYDGSYSSYSYTIAEHCGTAGSANYYYNISKSTADTGMMWQVKDEAATTNLTVLSSCFNAYSDKVLLSVQTVSSWCNFEYVAGITFYCYDGSWQPLRARYIGPSTSDNSKFYESTMFITNQSSYTAYAQVDIHENYTSSFTYNNDPLSTAGMAINLTGDKYISLPALSQFNVRQFTYAFWIKLNSWGSAAFRIVSKGDTGSCFIGRHNSENKLVSWCPGLSNAVYSNNLDVGRWYHVAAVYDGTNMIMYLDGKVLSSVAVTGSPVDSTYNLTIGSDPQNTSKLINASIDELLMYNIPLTANQIKQLAGGYNSSINLTLIDQMNGNNLVGVDVDVISDTVTREYTDVSRNEILNGLPNEFITIRHKADGYIERLYYINITTYSNQDLNVYELNDTISSNITFTVYDSTHDGVEGAYVYLLCYFIENNSYITVEMAKSNSEGAATFSGALNTEFCKYQVYYPFATLKTTTAPDYLRSVSPYTQISLTDTIGDVFDRSNDIESNLTFNNVTHNFRLDFINVVGSQETVQLKAYKLYNGEKTLLNSSTAVATAGTVLTNIGTPVNGTIYLAEASILVDNKEQPLNTADKVYEIPNPFKLYGLFMVLMMLILAAVIAYFSIIIALVLVGLIPLTATLVKVVPLSLLPVSVGIFVLSIIVAIMLSREAT